MNQFQCEIVRQKRKTLGLYVKHRWVEVRVPLRASKRDVETFIATHRDWIEERLIAEAQRHKNRLRIEHGGKILYKARELNIEFRDNRRERVLIEDKTFVIQGHKLTQEKAKVIVERYLQNKAKEYIVPRATGLAQHLGVAGDITDIRFRKTKTKWGHCTSEGNIQYNPSISLAPLFVIDYIIAHEVCHLRHRNHSKSFWQLVEKVCPDWQQAEKWLNTEAHRIAIGPS
mgnify:CR=1 FL=1